MGPSAAPNPKSNVPPPGVEDVADSAGRDSEDLPPPPPPPPPEDAESSLHADFDESERPSLENDPRWILDRLKPRWQRTKRDESKYFAVNTHCLGCGAECHVKVDALHAILRCRSCGTVMHMDNIGEWKLGVPPTLLNKKDAKPSPGDRQRRGKRKQPGSSVLDRFPVLKSRVVQVALIAGLLLVLFVAGLSLFRKPESQFPPTLRGRAEALCRAVINGDRETALKLTSKASDKDARTWFDAVKQRTSRDKSKYPSPPSIKLTVIAENKERHNAVVTATFRYAPRRTIDNADERETAERTVDIILYWTYERDQWLLDGTRTLKKGK
jgi:hypothetical protein